MDGVQSVGRFFLTYNTYSADNDYSMQLQRPETEESAEWLISYSDLMSLFLCFFIMLFALSTMQEERIETTTASLRGGFGLFGSSNPHNTGTAAVPLGPQMGGVILFDLGSDDLSSAAKRELNEMYRQLLSTPGGIQIVGQAGLGEPSAYRRELDLAYSRAIAVWDHLVSLGMDRERLQIVQQVGEDTAARVEIRRGR